MLVLGQEAGSAGEGLEACKRSLALVTSGWAQGRELRPKVQHAPPLPELPPMSGSQQAKVLLWHSGGTAH